jgi:hypothetical protein
VDENDRIGKLYNHVRKEIEDLLTAKLPIEEFKGLVYARPNIRRRRLTSFVVKRYDGIHTGRPAGGKIARQQSHEGKTEYGAQET